MKEIMLYDLEAEQAVLCCMLMDKDSAQLGVEMLNGEDFQGMSNRKLFEAIKTVAERGTAPDLVTVKSCLEEKGQLSTIGGMRFIAETAIAVPTSAHMKSYVNIIIEKSQRRKYLEKAGKIKEAVLYAEYDALLTEVDSIQKINKNKAVDGLTPVVDIVDDILKHAIERKEGKAEITGLKTGFTDLDAYTGGFQNNNLVILAARPAMGKTAFALDIVRGAARKMQRSGIQKNIAVFSLEMSKEQLAKRLCSAELKISNDKFKFLDFDSNDIEKMLSGIDTIEENCAKIYIDDTPGASARDIFTKCHALKTKSSLDMGLIVIDYLQLMSGEKTGTREQEVSGISRELKGIAKKFNCPVLTLSQLSRTCETRPNHRPMLSDLRESGAIEQDADMVMFLYRDEYYNPDTEKENTAELIIAKHRDGAVGTVELSFIKNQTTFKDLEKGY